MTLLPPEYVSDRGVNMTSASFAYVLDFGVNITPSLPSQLTFLILG